MPTRTATVRAFAKINLGLRVLYRRPDNFHEIRTIFQTISLADEIGVSFTLARRTSVAVHGTPHIPDNLMERAARAILAEMRTPAEVEFTLQKHIPAGAGLGGGSSDAAAVLLMLPVLAGRAVSLNRLLRVAAPLGSDVPFFLFGGTVLGLGKGEELYALADLPARPAVLLTPAIHVSTPEAYRNLSAILTAPEPKLVQFQSSVREPLSAPLVNDFESALFPAHPRLKQLKRKLLASGAEQALMTGSGSALFGVFNRKVTCRGAVQSLSTEGAVATSLLTGARYRSEWQKHLKSHTEGNSWPPRSRYAQ
ncbi:MAG: 4-(cytidine 5'-diphospho)-2-C-methyl-D-erythritol kinase [Acidobacteriota bacterium]|nr:4-(cytidine 5'-diphospho)-2-C-methyl-D-erythritol kinase [Acidobacteriota bacterium]